MPLQYIKSTKNVTRTLIYLSRDHVISIKIFNTPAYAFKQLYRNTQMCVKYLTLCYMSLVELTNTQTRTHIQTSTLVKYTQGLQAAMNMHRIADCSVL